MADIDQRGSFYIGREYDIASRKTRSDTPLLYDSKDLTTHAVCVGMTGSGKTGLCLSVLEEAALQGVPAIAIDPKGDLSNLLLAFPNLQASDFRPWIETSEAQQQNMSPDQFAASQAELWKNGLAKWDQGPDRIRKYCDATERVIYTPGSNAGIPVTVLKSFRAPPAELVGDDEAFRDRISSATSGLLALLGIDADPVRSREHIFLSTLLEAAWRSGKDVDIAQMIRDIQRPPFSKVGAVDLESFYAAKDRTKLAMSLNNLLASPAFASWMEGEPLDIGKMFFTPAGKPRMAIVSIAHLDEAQRMFFVTILLNEVLAWIRTQPGTSNLRALLYMDEVFGYFPPTGNPPAKRPMLTLLKQARAFGLGCMLATQNPVDLDYKGLSNAGTWFLGRLQTERDKARVIEGLEGASAQAGAKFNRQQMEADLAALGNRVFLMNNVHQDAPTVFQTRWALSYLRGPLTREQIKTLMDPIRGEFAGGTTKQHTAASGDGADKDGKSAPAASRSSTPAGTNRPILPAGVREMFVAVSDRVPDGYTLQYRPALVGKAKVHFTRAASKIDTWQDLVVLQPIRDTPPDDIWDGASVLPQPPATDAEPDETGQFADLPTELAREKSYAIFQKQLGDHLYRTASLKLWSCDALDQSSQLDETQEKFRARLEPLAKAQIEPERKKLESQHAAALAKVDAEVAKQQAKVSAQRWQFFARLGSMLWVIVDTVMSAMGKGLPGRRRSLDPAFRAAATERGQQATAQVSLDAALAQKERIENDYQKMLEDLDAKFSPATLQLSPLEIKPKKTDIDVERVTLAWLPLRVDATGRAEAVYETPAAASGDEAVPSQSAPAASN
jgi:hypothetical protein